MFVHGFNKKKDILPCKFYDRIQNNTRDNSFLQAHEWHSNASSRKTTEHNVGKLRHQFYCLCARIDKDDYKALTFRYKNNAFCTTLTVRTSNLQVDITIKSQAQVCRLLRKTRLLVSIPSRYFTYNVVYSSMSCVLRWILLYCYRVCLCWVP